MATEEQWLKIHRLAMLGTVPAIAQVATRRLAEHWLRVSRFRDMEELCQQTVTLGPHAQTFYYLAWVQKRLGKRADALQLALKALRLYEA